MKCLSVIGHITPLTKAALPCEVRVTSRQQAQPEPVNSAQALEFTGSAPEQSLGPATALLL